VDLERDSIDELNLTEELRTVKTASGKTKWQDSEWHVTNPIVFRAAGKRLGPAKPQLALPHAHAQS
jgi:hypothetical protein